MSDDDVAEVTRLERLLLDPAQRERREEMRALLHIDYVEHGKSGRRWSREEVTMAVAADPAVPGPATDFSGVRLGGHAILLTYRITGSDGSLRSSVWVRESGTGWLLRFHQGTRSPS